MTGEKKNPLILESLGRDLFLKFQVPRIGHTRSVVAKWRPRVASNDHIKTPGSVWCAPFLVP